MERIYMGIDPGFSGAIAVIDPANESVRVSKMPATPSDIFYFLQDIKAESEKGNKTLSCVLEDVGHGLPGQSSSATAKFARHNGHLEMALLALGIPTCTATPQKWQKHYQMGSSKEFSKTQWKNKLKAKAQQLFPKLGKQITLATADALLIAKYASDKT